MVSASLYCVAARSTMLAQRLVTIRFPSIRHACRTPATTANVRCLAVPSSNASMSSRPAASRLLRAHSTGLFQEAPSWPYLQACNRHTCHASVNASASSRKIKYLYDGGCKVCQTFKSSLESQEGTKDRINYVNIADDSFSPKDHDDVTYDEAMSTIHAITSEGETLKGPDAVRALFGEAGSTTSFMAEASKLPGFDQLFGTAYDFLSEHRFELSDAAQKAQKTVGAQ